MRCRVSPRRHFGKEPRTRKRRRGGRVSHVRPRVGAVVIRDAVGHVERDARDAVVRVGVRVRPGGARHGLGGDLRVVEGEVPVQREGFLHLQRGKGQVLVEIDAVVVLRDVVARVWEFDVDEVDLLDGPPHASGDVELQITRVALLADMALVTPAVLGAHVDHDGVCGALE